MRWVRSAGCLTMYDVITNSDTCWSHSASWIEAMINSADGDNYFETSLHFLNCNLTSPNSVLHEEKWKLSLDMHKFGLDYSCICYKSFHTVSCCMHKCKVYYKIPNLECSYFSCRSCIHWEDFWNHEIRMLPVVFIDYAMMVNVRGNVQTADLAC